jgi:LEA14-like dessication related protein
VTLTDSDGKTGEEYNSDPMTQTENEKKKAEKKEKQKEKLKKMLKMDVMKRDKEIKKEIEDEKEKIQNKKEPRVKTSYKASFNIPAYGYWDADTQAGIVRLGDTEFEELGVQDGYVYAGKPNVKVDLTIDDNDFAKAKVTFTNGKEKIEWQLEGKFTCQQELDVTTKVKIQVPIWGTWTDRDVYAPVPKILKDYEKRQTQLAARETDPSAKVDALTYNNGKWLQLNKGKGEGNPYTYIMVEITDKYIIYEQGEIALWGAFGCQPTVSYKFPRDHQDNNALYSKKLSSYEQTKQTTMLSTTYNFRTDTLRPTSGFFNGTTLYRVKEAPIADVWSSVKGEEKPDAKKVRDKAGTWYEFKLAKGSYVDGKDGKEYVPSKMGGLTFEKTTVNRDGTAEILTGKAEIYAFDEAVKCVIEKRVTVDKDGKAAETAYAPKDDQDEDFEYETFTLAYTDYN